jgi:hypothetical protein
MMRSLFRLDYGLSLGIPSTSYYISSFPFHLVLLASHPLLRSFAYLTSPRLSSPLPSASLTTSYLGEVLLQFGPPILSTAVAPPQWRYIGFVSPLFTYLLLRYASGVPPLEKSAEKKWGNEEDWGRYRDSTGVLIPGVGKGKVA